MNVLVIGGSGMVGHELVQILSHKFDVWTTLRTSLKNYKKFQIFNTNRIFENVEVENFHTVEQVIYKLRPEVIVNAVGVIKQLPSSKNSIKTITINSLFPHRLAEASMTVNARLINVSTDCVFSGKKGNYNENDVADAEDLYGRSKLLGEVTERNCLTVRTSIIGRELQSSHSLVEWFLSNEGNSVKGFKNAIFSGVTTEALANVFADLIENHSGLEGLYHVSNEPINKYDLLCLLKKAFNANIEILPELDFQINRSLNSEKFRRETGFKPLSWEEMVEKMAQDKTPYKNKK